MTKDETATLLALISALDRQPVDEGMVEMWHELLGNYSFDECREALMPVYKSMKGPWIRARDIYDHVRAGTTPPAEWWVRDLHDIGEHFACRPGLFGHPERGYYYNEDGQLVKKPEVVAGE
jgi:hypothetical protein